MIHPEALLYFICVLCGKQMQRKCGEEGFVFIFSTFLHVKITFVCHKAIVLISFDLCFMEKWHCHRMFHLFAIHTGVTGQS